MNPSDLLANIMSGKLVVVVQTEPTKPIPATPKLVPEEQELADALLSIAKKYGKFNEDETGIWAGYVPAKDNVVSHIGVKCSNCALYEGKGVCKIIAQKVEDAGKCRFAVIPDGVVNGVYDPAKTPVIPQSSGKRKIKVKIDDTSSSCPKATKDIATNLKNRSKAIKAAMYGPLNPDEPNEQYYKNLGAEWDVSAEQAKKQTCGNCAMFIVTPEMKSCIEQGVTGPQGKDKWEAIDGAGHLGYCEAFDFKCASKRTCRAWVNGGPITETKSVKIRPSVKALGRTIGGGNSTNASDMIDRDGDGVVLDGTPDEQPVKRKPKPATATANDRRRHQFIADDRGGSLRAEDGQYLQAMDDGSVSAYDGEPDKNYERLPNTFLEQRRRREVGRDLAAAGETPDQMPNRSDRERALRIESRDDFSVDQDRRRFVRNELRKRGIQRNVDSQRTDEERQARREARAEYDRRVAGGEPRKPKTSSSPAPSPKPETTYPPGYVPGRPADRYPVPKPDTSWQDNEDRRNAAKRPVGRPVDRLPGAQPGYPKPNSPAEPQEEWDGIVRSRGMEWVSDKYPNRSGGANSPLRNDPKWIAEQIEKQRASKPPQRTGNRGAAAKMPNYNPPPRPTAKMPNYNPPPQTGGGRFKPKRDN